MAVHPFYANGFRFSQIRETPTKTPTVPISGAYGLREAEWLVRGSEPKGVWGQLGSCSCVDRTQTFLLAFERAESSQKKARDLTPCLTRLFSPDEQSRESAALRGKTLGMSH